MVSFGHPVHRQDAKEKPLQTQEKQIIEELWVDLQCPTAGDRVCHRELAWQSDHNPWEHCKAPQVQWKNI